jgi:predicted AlkP superfamily pyrophosphatase or phosphodiesterase
MKIFYLQRGIKLVLSKTLVKLLGDIKKRENLEIYNIPFSIIKYFDISTKSPIDGLNVTSLFNILNQQGISYIHLDSGDLPPKEPNKLITQLKNVCSNKGLILMDIDYADYAAHRYGLENINYLTWLRKVDSLVKLSIDTVENSIGKKVLTIILSDHGIVPVKRIINAEPLIRHPSFGKDFICFLDSTMIHIWYLSEERKSQIRFIINRLGYGHLLTPSEKTMFRINFRHRLYGDDIYLLDPSTAIFPNFISLVNPKAMHAYDPRYTHQYGFIMLIDYSKSVKERQTNLSTNFNSAPSIVDLMPTILDILKLPKPITCEGKSLVKINKHFTC